MNISNFFLGLLLFSPACAAETKDVWEKAKTQIWTSPNQNFIVNKLPISSENVKNRQTISDLSAIWELTSYDKERVTLVKKTLVITSDLSNGDTQNNTYGEQQFTFKASSKIGDTKLVFTNKESFEQKEFTAFINDWGDFY